jgi:hypothetical protein
MTWCEIWWNLAINLVAGVIIFLAGFFWPRIPKSIKMYRLKKFFGNSVLTERFAIVYGTLQDPRPRFDPAGKPLLRFRKEFKDGKIADIVGPFENIVGECEIRATGYLAQNIGKVREQTISILSDIKAYNDINSSFIAIGSPSSNDISGFIMRETANQFYNFTQVGNQVFIEAIMDKKRYLGFQPPAYKDCAVLMRIRNDRFPEHFLFVCAGLGEWGSSGASWFLATHWENLYKEFKNDNFALILEVDVRSDTSTKRIASLRKSSAERVR